jgi:hypothetical protein
LLSASLGSIVNDMLMVASSVLPSRSNWTSDATVKLVSGVTSSSAAPSHTPAPSPSHASSHAPMIVPSISPHASPFNSRDAMPVILFQ